MAGDAPQFCDGFSFLLLCKWTKAGFQQHNTREKVCNKRNERKNYAANAADVADTTAKTQGWKRSLSQLRQLRYARYIA